MKQVIYDENKRLIFFVLIALFLLLVSHSISARLLHDDDHLIGTNEDVKADHKIIHAASSTLTEEDNDLFSLTGLEEYCDEKDEVCVKRRMMAEAHLDYIYSQRHKQRASSP